LTVYGSGDEPLADVTCDGGGPWPVLDTPRQMPMRRPLVPNVSLAMTRSTTRPRKCEPRLAGVGGMMTSY
jgi:hypothetical protein